MEYREYILAWAAYLGACGVLIIIGCLWTRVIGNAFVRGVIRLMASTALLLPVPHEDAGEFLVPVLVVVIVGGLTGERAAFANAATVLAVAEVIAFFAAIALVIAGRHLRSRWAARRAAG